jgi:hypothetical protein
MVWIELDCETYYPIYECSNCGTQIMVEDYLQLPCYCKVCESSWYDDEGDNESYRNDDDGDCRCD